ncbi:uncharacterized protein V6R79_017083 [Siganus canaliculatus]
MVASHKGTNTQRIALELDIGCVTVLQGFAGGETKTGCLCAWVGLMLFVPHQSASSLLSPLSLERAVVVILQQRDDAVASHLSYSFRSTKAQRRSQAADGTDLDLGASGAKPGGKQNGIVRMCKRCGGHVEAPQCFTPKRLA